MWISPTGPYPESLKWRVEVWPQCPPQTLWGSDDARAGLQRLVEDLVVVPKKCFSCTVSGQVISLLSFYRIVMLFVIFSSVFSCFFVIRFLFVCCLSWSCHFWSFSGLQGLGRRLRPKLTSLQLLSQVLPRFGHLMSFFLHVFALFFIMFVPFFVVSCHCYFWDWLVFELSETKLNDKITWRMTKTQRERNDENLTSFWQPSVCARKIFATNSRTIPCIKVMSASANSGHTCSMTKPITRIWQKTHHETNI